MKFTIALPLILLQLLPLAASVKTGARALKGVDGIKKKNYNYTDLIGFHEARLPSDYMIFTGWSDKNCNDDLHFSHGYPLGVCQLTSGGNYYLNLAAYDPNTEHTLLAYQFYSDVACTNALSISGTYNWKGCESRDTYYKRFQVGEIPQFPPGVLFQTFPSEHDCKDGTYPVDYNWLKYDVCTRAIVDFSNASALTGGTDEGRNRDTIATCNKNEGKVTLTAYNSYDASCTGGVWQTLTWSENKCYKGSATGFAIGNYGVECL